MKKVMLPLTVPDSEYCWVFNANFGEICQHFDNSGGIPKCEIFKVEFLDKEDDVGIFKPDCCNNLTEN